MGYCDVPDAGDVETKAGDKARPKEKCGSRMLREPRLIYRRNSQHHFSKTCPSNELFVNKESEISSRLHTVHQLGKHRKK